MVVLLLFVCQNYLFLLAAQQLGHRLVSVKRKKATFAFWFIVASLFALFWIQILLARFACNFYLQILLVLNSSLTFFKFKFYLQGLLAIITCDFYYLQILLVTCKFYLQILLANFTCNFTCFTPFCYASIYLSIFAFLLISSCCANLFWVL